MIKLVQNGSGSVEKIQEKVKIFRALKLLVYAHRCT